MRFTIFGGRGFIGGALARRLREAGHQVVVPERDDITPGGNLGHVVYAIGLTADFRSRPFETIDAHVCGLHRRLANNLFDSWLYLSSTRVYSGLDVDPVDETTPLTVRPDADGIYNLSKLTGEALCLAIDRPGIRIARVSNVFGFGAHSNSFLGMVLADIAAGRDVLIREGAGSSKDYIAIEDVCYLLERIAIAGDERIYNVASGVPITHGAIVDALDGIAHARVRTSPTGPVRRFPRIDVSRASNEFGFTARPVLDALAGLVEYARGPA